MKLSSKAALFSAFVFPGSGYFVVKQKPKGFIYLGIFLSTLALLMVEAVHKAMYIANKIVAGHISFDITAIREQILLAPGRFDATMIAFASWLIAILWLISIIDAYRLGRALDK